MRQPTAVRRITLSLSFLILLAIFPATALAQRLGGGNEAPDFSSLRISPSPFPSALLADTGLRLAGPSPRLRWFPPQRRVWYALSIAQYGSAFFDAYTTRQMIDNYRELDPLLRPFAHSAAIYPVVQVMPLGMDWLGARMAHSRNRWLRRLWWLPQAASTAGHIWAGVHNLRLPSNPAAASR